MGQGGDVGSVSLDFFSLTRSHIASANLQLAVYPTRALNFYLPKVEITTFPVVLGKETETSVHAKQGPHQLSYIPRPSVVLLCCLYVSV